MKKKLLAVLLLGGLTLTACGSSKPNEELDSMTNEIIIMPDGVTLTPTQTPTETPMAEAPAEENVTNQETSEEESAPYILNFEASTTEGEAWNSDKLANSRLTMINVWATYCNPCLAEMPDLGEIASEYDVADFQLIGIISDVMEGDDAEMVDYAKELITETKANYPHLLLNESLYVNLIGAVSAVPTTFFVNQEGELLGYVTGAQSKENWKMLIDQLLTEME